MKKFNSTFKFLGSLALASTLLTGSALLTGCSSTGTSSTTTTSPGTTTVYSQFLYNVNLGPAGATPGVTEFVQHLDSGALTAGTTAAAQALFPAGNGANSIAINPGGQFAYVANRTDNTISQFTINSFDGSWTGVAAPGGIGTGSGGPQSGVIDPLGRFYFTANNTGGDISSYAIQGATGALSFVSATAQTVAGPAGKIGGMVVDPSAQFVYAGATNGLYLYSINANGSLSAQAPVASISGLGPVNGGACDTSGHVFFSVGNGATSGIVAFTIGANGQLTQYTNGLPLLPAGSNPTKVVYEPSHQALFIALTNAGNGAIAAFSVNPGTGALTSVGVVSAGTNINDLAFDPTGSFLYCSNTNAAGTIGAFQILNGGVLTAINSGAGFVTNQFPTSLRTLQYASYQTRF